MAEYWSIEAKWSPWLFCDAYFMSMYHSSWLRCIQVCTCMHKHETKHTVCTACIGMHGHTGQTGHTWHMFLLCIIIISLFGGIQIKCIKNIYHNYGKDGAVSLLLWCLAYIQLYLYIHSGYHSIQDRPSGWKIPHGWVLRYRGKMKSLPFCDAYFKALYHSSWLTCIQVCTCMQKHETKAYSMPCIHGHTWTY